MKNMMLALFAAALWTGCNDKPGYNSVDVATFAEVISDKNIQLIDTRTPEEYAAGHIPGAININIEDPNFDSEVNRLVEKERPVAVYCKGGRRSKIAAERILSIGYKDITELNTGFTTWTGEVAHGEEER